MRHVAMGVLRIARWANSLPMLLVAATMSMSVMTTRKKRKGCFSSCRLALGGYSTCAHDSRYIYATNNSCWLLIDFRMLAPALYGDTSPRRKLHLSLCFGAVLDGCAGFSPGTLCWPATSTR